LPIVYGAEATVATAVRWKAQLNENAKVPAFSAALPEANHNELCGFAPGLVEAPLHAVFLEEPGMTARMRRRIELTRASLDGSGTPVDRLVGRGDTPVERVLSLVLLGDLVSVYLAVLAQVDPTPVPRAHSPQARLGLAKGRPRVCVPVHREFSGSRVSGPRRANVLHLAPITNGSS
jgi:glucose/mannose-6-phosphate isomerase